MLNEKMYYQIRPAIRGGPKFGSPVDENKIVETRTT
jgi:hypothetical protein